MRETNSSRRFSTDDDSMVPMRRHDDGKLAQLVVVEQGPDLGAVLLAERKHQNGRPFRPGQLASGGVFALPAGERRDHIRDVDL